jgi:Rap1a immunity proteins
MPKDRSEQRRCELKTPPARRAGVAFLVVTALVPIAPVFGNVVSAQLLFHHCTSMTGPASPTPDVQMLNNDDRLNIWLGGSSLGYCYGYIEGVVDAQDAGTFCIPAGTTAAEFGAVAIQYLREHPELRNYNAAGVVAKALDKAFPCRK